MIVIVSHSEPFEETGLGLLGLGLVDAPSQTHAGRFRLPSFSQALE